MSEYEEIADLAKWQGEGPYTIESDARTALALIERIARALHNAEQPAVNATLGAEGQ